MKKNGFLIYSILIILNIVCCRKEPDKTVHSSQNGSDNNNNVKSDPPLVTLKLSKESVSTGERMQITVHAHGTSSPVKHILLKEFDLSGNRTYIIKDSSCSTLDFYKVFDTRIITPSTHLITFIATDSLGGIDSTSAYLTASGNVIRPVLNVTNMVSPNIHPGDNVTFRISGSTAGNPLARLQIVLRGNGPADSILDLKLTGLSLTKNYTYQVPATFEGRLDFTFILTDDRNISTQAYTTLYAYNIDEHASLYLDAQGKNNDGGGLDIVALKKYLISSAGAQNSDLVYNYDNTGIGPVLFCPAANEAQDYYSAIKNWSTRKVTTFKATSTDYYDFESLAGIQYDFNNNSNPALRSIKNFQGGETYVFRLDNGKYGAMRINYASGGTTGSVGFNIKIQYK